MNKKKRLIAVLCAGMLSMTLLGCQPASEESKEIKDAPLTTFADDPRNGWTAVIDRSEVTVVAVYKICDNDTLIYVTPGYQAGAHGIAVVPNSPQC